MVVHVALFAWKPEVSPDAVGKLMADIRGLKMQVPQIMDIYAGENFSPWGEEYTHAVVATFKTRGDLGIYRSHPAHKPIADLCDAWEASSIGFDFES